MRKLPPKHHLIPAMVLATFFAMPIYAIAQTDGLEVMQQNAITYVTGGVGDEERDALQAAKADYNLHILNSRADGAFVGNVHLSITDKSGTELVSSDAGPIFYAKLPAGAYTVAATHNEETQKKSIHITKSSKASNIAFAWKPTP